MAMKLILITGSYPPEKCGVGDYTHQLSVSLAALPNADVSVLTLGCVNSEFEQGVTVHRCVPNWSLRTLPTLLGILKKVRPDIVHIQYPTQGYGFAGLPWLLPLLGRMSGARVVQTWHERFNRRDFLKFLAMVFVPGQIIVVRDAWQRQFKGLFGLLISLRHPVCIKLASNIPRSIATQASIDDVRLKFGAEGRRLIVFFGFVHPLKRIELLFDIANPDTDQLVIIGNIGDQFEYAARIEALIVEKNWYERARLVGFIDKIEVADCLKAADALILPFQHGATEGNASILAGIEQGTFVLTTSTSAAGYDSETNIYYAPVDGLMEMQQALNKYAGFKRNVAAQNGDVFDWGTIAARHFELYEALVGHRTSLDLQSEKDPA